MTCKLQNSRGTHIWRRKRIRTVVRKVRVPKATPSAEWKFTHRCGSIAGEAFKTIIRGLGVYRLPRQEAVHTLAAFTLSPPGWTHLPFCFPGCGAVQTPSPEAKRITASRIVSQQPHPFFPSFRSSAVGTGNGARHFSLRSLLVSSLTRSEGGRAGSSSAVYKQVLGNYSALTP